MLRDNLVSLIAPFFNGEKYLDRFLTSVLFQTYSNIQFILVNDGSTDRSDEIVEKYSILLTDKITEFIYIKQKNGGAAFAVNEALKYVKGEYLCWADCDDELAPENVRSRYQFLKENKEYGMVNCGAKAVSQNTGKPMGNLVIPKDQRKDNMFLQIINGVPVYPGVFMIRTELLFEKLDNREIYFTKEAGQNYQLLLPVAYDSRCGFIDDILYTYYVRADSHSHDVDYEKKYERTYVREELLDKVLVFMPKWEKDKIMKLIRYECAVNRFNMSFSTDDKLRNNSSYNELKPYSRPLILRLKHIIISNELLNIIYRKMFRLRGKNK